MVLEKFRGFGVMFSQDVDVSETPRLLPAMKVLSSPALRSTAGHSDFTASQPPKGPVVLR